MSCFQSNWQEASTWIILVAHLASRLHRMNNIVISVSFFQRLVDSFTEPGTNDSGYGRLVSYLLKLLDEKNGQLWLPEFEVGRRLNQQR